MANSVRPACNSGRPVVNCFQISNFVLWQTARSLLELLKLVLWIAFKLVILSYGKQPRVNAHTRDLVVNCFQISNFVLWQTAPYCGIAIETTLWIAFKLVILSYGKQQCSELHHQGTVVNCFQISNFVLWQTALILKKIRVSSLWIAFKLVILSYGKQPTAIMQLATACCELLSN